MGRSVWEKAMPFWSISVKSFLTNSEPTTEKLQWREPRSMSTCLGISPTSGLRWSKQSTWSWFREPTERNQSMRVTFARQRRKCLILWTFLSLSCREKLLSFADSVFQLRILPIFLRQLTLRWWSSTFLGGRRWRPGTIESWRTRWSNRYTPSLDSLFLKHISKLTG